MKSDATSHTVRELSAAELAGNVILAIDTSLGTSVALGAQGHIVEKYSDDPRGHAEVIGTLLAGVFQESGVDPADVTHVVAGMGPGPFTGLRVGIAAAHAFAAGRGLSVSPLVSHDAAALDVLESGATAEMRVIHDAKRRELFVTGYSSLDWAGLPVREVDPHLEPREGFEAATNDHWPERVSAGSLVRLAARKLATGSEFEVNRALYLRQPDVKQPGLVKRVST